MLWARLFGIVVFLSLAETALADEAEVFQEKRSPEFALIAGFSPKGVKEKTDGFSKEVAKPAGDRFTVVLSKLVPTTKVEKVEVERDGKKVVEERPIGFELRRELFTLELFVKDWRLSTVDGKEVGWDKAVDKVVLLNWSSGDIDPVYRNLLAKDALILLRKK